MRQLSIDAMTMTSYRWRAARCPASPSSSSSSSLARRWRRVGLLGAPCSADPLPSHALPWPGGRLWSGSSSRWGCRRHRRSARRMRCTSSPWIFGQSCDLYISEKLVQICTRMSSNVRVFYEFEVKNNNKSDLKLSSPSFGSIFWLLGVPIGSLSQI